MKTFLSILPVAATVFVWMNTAEAASVRCSSDYQEELQRCQQWCDAVFSSSFTAESHSKLERPLPCGGCTFKEVEAFVDKNRIPKQAKDIEFNRDEILKQLMEQLEQVETQKNGRFWRDEKL